MLSDFQVSEHIRCMDCNSVNNANTSSSKPDIHPFASQASSQECRKNFTHLHHKCQTTCWGVDWWMLGLDEVVMCFGFLTILITELTTWICSLMHLKLRQQMACWNDNSLLQYIWPKSWLPMVSVIKGIPLYFHVLVIRSICQYWWHVSLWLWYGLLLPATSFDYCICLVACLQLYKCEQVLLVTWFHCSCSLELSYLHNSDYVGSLPDSKYHQIYHSVTYPQQMSPMVVKMFTEIVVRLSTL